MVTQVMSLTRSGLADFVIQRATAFILAAYTFCLLGFFLGTSPITYESLTAFFWSTPMQLFSTLAALSIAGHAWVGMWTIGTDYLREAHIGGSATVVRVSYQMICMLVLFVYMVWSLQLIWQF